MKDVDEKFDLDDEEMEELGQMRLKDWNEY